jgi:hypothetical protein
MDNVTDTLFHLPGWYWYLQGEKDIHELSRHQAEYFLNVFLRIMYKEFRVMGYHEFETQCNLVLPPRNEPYIKWFYNRQPIFQITQKPISSNHSHVTIPLQREQASEIQMDILQLNEHFLM